MIRPKLWSGKSLLGEWVVSAKIDGVRAISDGKEIVSRKGKPLFNVQHLVGLFTDAEIFLGSFKDTVSTIRASCNPKRVVTRTDVFSLDPLDTRLFVGVVNNPTAKEINNLLKKELAKGNEGLVLRQGDTWLKVIPKQTYDVKITAVIPGKGKHAGRMGAVMTSMGKVGTGFTDDEREWFATHNCVGDTIEVECKQLTEDGKFRHPRYKRERWDKDADI